METPNWLDAATVRAGRGLYSSSVQPVMLRSIVAMVRVGQTRRTVFPELACNVAEFAVYANRSILSELLHAFFQNLLLLPGDGIGPEVMAEVKAVIAFMNEAGLARLRDRGGSGRRRRLRRARRGDHRRGDGEGARRRRGALRRGRRAEMGQGRLRAAARGGAAPAPQGARRLRQSPPGDLLSGARRRLVAEARAGRGARHPDPARADRRRLFRRAEGDPRPRQRPEARHRHAGLRHLRDRAHRPRRLRAGADAPQQGDLDGEAQRHGVGRAVERGGRRACTATNIPT